MEDALEQFRNGNFAHPLADERHTEKCDSHLPEVETGLWCLVALLGLFNFTDKVDNDREYIIVESVELKMLIRSSYGILWS
jgi:hypothetical protein